MKKEIIKERIPKARKTFYTKYIKRLLDVTLSGTAIVFLSPVFVTVAGLELVYHGRPIVFSQERPGLHGKIFKIYKFRSMTNDTDENGELLPATERLTDFGRMIRRYSIDELPELFCILTGKMSIIGPRPLRVEYLPLYNKRYAKRHDVKPGLAIVRLKRGTTWTWRDQFENDIWYIENCSFLTDVKMVFAVAWEAINPGKYRVEATRTPFDGTNYDV